MLKNSKKKGFTIVELVIVIAVIAILAAVLIPTFSNIVRKANISSDTQLVRNLNTALALDNKEHKTMQSALDAAEEGGFDVAKISSKISENKILWDSKNDVFCYLNGDTVEYVPNSVVEGDKLLANSHMLWKISAEIDPVYSTYLYNYEVTETSKDITTTKGIDVGETTGIKSIKYNGIGTSQNVIIRTNSYETEIELNAYVDSTNPNVGDHIELFGNHANVAGVDGNKAVVANNSLVFNQGIIGRALIESGRVVANGEGTAICALVGNATPEVTNGAVIYDRNGEAATNSNDMTNTTVDDCGKGNHSVLVEMIIDNHMYEVCTKCGYSLVHVGGETTTKVDSTNNIVITPVETYETSSLDDNGKIPEGETPSISTPIVNQGTNASCNHTFDNGVVIKENSCLVNGETKYTCTKCGLYYVQGTKPDHLLVHHDAKTATCTENGWNEYDECTRCGYSTKEVLTASHIDANSDNVCDNCLGIIVRTYQELSDALSSATYIIFNNDIKYETNGSEVLNSTRSLTIDGNGYTLSGWGNRGGNKTTIAINHNGSTMVDVTFRNLTIKNTADNGRPIETRGKINSLTLENVTINATGTGNTQGLTIGGNQSTNATISIKDSKINAGSSGYPIISFNPMTLLISDSRFSGYCGIYFKGVSSSAGSRGSIVTATNTEFDCPNLHATGSNDFGVFSLEDDGINITLNNCKINAEEKNTANQAVFVLSNIAGRQTEQCIFVINGEGSVVGDIIDNAWSNDNYSLSINGGTFAVDPSLYVDEEHDVVERSALGIKYWEVVAK